MTRTSEILWTRPVMLDLNESIAHAVSAAASAAVRIERIFGACSDEQLREVFDFSFMGICHTLAQHHEMSLEETIDFVMIGSNYACVTRDRVLSIARQQIRGRDS